MSSFSSSLEQQDEEVHNNICEKHNELLGSLPKGHGWGVLHLYKYKGFWLHQDTVKNNLLLHTFFRPRPTDIFLASFMKSGTTWLKALMFSTLYRHRYTFSHHHLLTHSPQSTFPFLDCESYPLTDFTNIPDPRLFATHFPHTLLPPSVADSGKIVYVCRDPKDVLISKWIFLSKHRSKDLPPLTLNDAFELFCEGVAHYGPFWEHVLSYWRASLEDPNKVLFLRYEEIKENPEVVVRRLAAFMGNPMTPEEENKGVVSEIVKLCSFENLSSLEVNKNGVEKFGTLLEAERSSFFRKGEIGDWKNYLSEKMKERIDGITREKLQGSGLILNVKLE